MMKGNGYAGWFRAGMDAWALGLEASTVIALRTAKLAAGGEAAAREAQLMVTEKVSAAIEMQAALIGATPLGGTTRAIRHYRRKVATNRRRLTR